VVWWVSAVQPVVALNHLVISEILKSQSLQHSGLWE